MFLTVIYAVASACQWLYQRYCVMSIRRLIRNHMPHSSVVLRRCIKSSSDSISGMLSSKQKRVVLVSDEIFELSTLEPQVSFCLEGWTQLSKHKHGSVNILMKLVHATEGVRTNCKQVNSLCNVLAVKTDKADCVLAQCSHDDFDTLVQCYVSGVSLVTGTSYLVDSLTTVNLVDKLEESSQQGSRASVFEQSQHRASVFEQTRDEAFMLQKSRDKVAVLEQSGDALSTSALDSRRGLSDEMQSESLDKLATEVSRKATLRSKPPNILIYCGKKDSTRLYETVKSVVCQCINTSRYTVYHLKHDHVTTTPWNENISLLVIASDKVYDGVDQHFLNYFLSGGTLISFGSVFDSLIVRRKDRACEVKGISVLMLQYDAIEKQDFAVICTRYCYDVTKTVLPGVRVTSVATDRDSREDVIVEATIEVGSGVAILSQVNLDKDPVEMAISNEVFKMLKRSNNSRFQALTRLLSHIGVDCTMSEIPSLTAVHLLTNSEAIKSSLLSSVSPRLQDGRLISRDLTLHFVDDENSHLSSISSQYIPVLTRSHSSLGFDTITYYKHHSASVLGNTVLYADVITTTMTLFEGLMFSCPHKVGLVAVARRQVAGQGRGGNAWLSPSGCAMFSLHVRIPLLSTLGQRITYIQHLMALAVVLAVRQRTGCQTVDLRIKWPNDVYFGRDVKLGGVIVKSTIMDNIIHANIGCGVNITNKDPTMCINDLLCRVDASSKPDCFTVEEFIARSVSKLEQLITEFQTLGQEAFLKQYYEYWLHSNANVRLGSDTGPEATVVGLDEYGFLLVRLQDDGRTTVSVQPDGNSYDMMKNLILPKNS